jgi:hypothetical protein
VLRLRLIDCVDGETSRLDAALAMSNPEFAPTAESPF